MLRYLCGLVVLALASASDVLEFNDNNFEVEVLQHSIILIEFYAPWCGHCKALAPEFEKAATKLAAGEDPVALAKVDCAGDGKDACSKHGVSGYPTLKIFKNGVFASDYSGPRQADGIVKYMMSKAGPSSRFLKTYMLAEKFIQDSPEHSIVGFFDKEGSDLHKQFEKLSDAMNEDFRFGHTFSEDIMDRYKYKNVVVLFQPRRLYNKFEERSVKYEGEMTMYKMKNWISANVHGLCGHRTSSNQDQFKKPLVIAYYDLDYVKNPKGTNYWRNRVLKVAKKMKEAGKDINFAISDKDDFNFEVSEFGLEIRDEKPVIGAKDSKDQKFPMKDIFSVEALEQFANELADGKLQPYLKSEKEPVSNEGPVKIVTANKFDELVNNEEKDVLIEFYAPWCGHCKSLEPKFEKLARKLKGETDILIAKMDATANDVPKPYEVQGFPTLYFASKNGKAMPKKYEGGREVDDFFKYIAREATDELKGFDRDGQKKKGKKGDKKTEL